MLIHLLPKDASGSIKIPNPLAWMQSEVIGLHKNQILSQRAVKYLSAHQLDTYRESYLELMLLLGRQGLGYLFTSVHLCPTLPISQCFYSLLHPLVWPKGNFKASGWCLGALTLGDRTANLFPGAVRQCDVEVLPCEMGKKESTANVWERGDQQSQWECI